jgi:peptidoglycan/LPS O-acetylase OafA/YrhL
MTIAVAGPLQDQLSAPPRGAAATTRVASLDALRGLAALSVVACHFLLLLADTPFGHHLTPWLQLPPFSLFQTAYGAVILFFVLSGYVLALSLAGDNGPPSWGGFAVRRFCRIWPPFALTILISFVIGYVAVSAEPAVGSIWQNNTWQRGDLGLWAFAGQISMAASQIGLDMPGWSLVYELRITLAFPLLLLVLRWAPASTIGVSFCLQLASRLGPPWLTALIPATATFIVFFAAGAWLAVDGAPVARLRRASPTMRTVLAGVAVLFLSVPSGVSLSGVIAGLGAVLIIAVVVASPEIDRVLSVPCCVALGRVSYSLYLTHVVVLMALGRLLGSLLPVWMILAIAAPVIAVVACAGYRWVEQPSIRLGRSIASRLRG